jgi:hypothetical protein
MQHRVCLNVLKSYFDSKSDDKVKISQSQMKELARHFGNAKILELKEWYSFENFVHIIVPDLLHAMKIAPFNELKRAFSESVDPNSKYIELAKVQRYRRFYNLVGWMLDILKSEPITFHNFVDWFCKETDMVRFIYLFYHFFFDFLCLFVALN